MTRAGIRFLLNGKKSSNTHGGNSAEIKYRFAEAVRGFDTSSKGYFTLVGRFPNLN